MAAYFPDSSAVIKRYVQETGTAWVQALVHPAAQHSVYVARITAVEICAAIARRQRGRTISPAAAAAALARFRLDVAQEYLVSEITVPLLSDAERQAEIHGLRAYDAVQLAAVLLSVAEITKPSSVEIR